MSERAHESEQLNDLTARLQEAEETLRAVRGGEIDAFVVQGPGGDQVYALRSTEQPYRTLVEEMQEAAAILTPEGDIVYCNRRFAQLVGVPLESVIGGEFDRYIGSIDRAPYRSLLKKGCGKLRAKLRTTQGTPVEVYLSLTTSKSEDIERRNLIITDLSELLDARNDRDRAQQQSQAKDEFVAMLAHELRNPLSAITAAVQVMEAAQIGERSDHPAVKARAIVGRQAKHLARLVDDLLDVGRAVTGKIVLDRHLIDLADTVRRGVALFGERECRHHIRVETGADPVWIDGDAVRIEQIVSNIVSNAVKYTPANGSIYVTLETDDKHAVLRVEDTGSGIAPDLLPRIFDLFVQGERTLDRSQGGIGIGLTLVRRLVELHNGTISATSPGPGLGSTFSCRLPLAMTQHAYPGDSTHGVESASRRVVIIEDNRDAREMVRMMLELSGHQVLEAEAGPQGLALLKSELPDIAVIDVGLPGLDGYEVARRFRQEAAANQVLLVALTGYGTPDAFARSREAGFDHHLIKPVNPEVLRDILCQAGKRGGAAAGFAEAEVAGPCRGSLAAVPSHPASAH